MSELSRHYPLEHHNTLGLIAIAPACLDIEVRNDLRRAYTIAADEDLQPLVLGEGSNVVLADLSNRLVLLMQLSGIEVLEDTDDSVMVRVAAGENWHRFVLYAHQKRWFGMENLALIPGTVGAAPVQNIGAYGVEIASFIETVEVFDLRSGTFAELDNAACQFAYRDSVFKHPEGNHYVICSVTLRFDRNSEPNIRYAALRAELDSLGGHARAIDVLNAVIGIREAKLPDPAKLPNVGSFFKNPIISHEAFETLRQIAPNVAHWDEGDNVKLAAAWLVERAGWRGHNEARVGVHAKQSLVLVNRGGASSGDFLDLAERIRVSVMEQFGVDLEIEPTVVRGV